MDHRYDESWPPPYEEEETQEALDIGSLQLDVEEPDSDLGPRERRSSVLPGVLGVFLIVLLGVAVWWAVRTVLLGAGSAATPTPVWTPAVTSSTSPAVAPTPAETRATPAAVDTPEPSVADLSVGQTVRVVGTDGQGISFRSGAGADFTRLDILDEGTELVVLEGPETADGYEWWQLRSSDGTVGWAAADWLEPVVTVP